MVRTELNDLDRVLVDAVADTMRVAAEEAEEVIVVN